eukprot:jgi/Chrzof1/14665/Cz09g11100.t1
MENVNERYIPLNVRTYREGWLKLQGWICVSLLAFLTGGLLVLYELMILNVEDQDFRDMLFDYRTTQPGVRYQHKHFVNAQFCCNQDPYIFKYTCNDAEADSYGGAPYCPPIVEFTCHRLNSATCNQTRQVVYNAIGLDALTGAPIDCDRAGRVRLRARQKAAATNNESRTLQVYWQGSVQPGVLSIANETTTIDAAAVNSFVEEVAANYSNPLYKSPSVPLHRSVKLNGRALFMYKNYVPSIWDKWGAFGWPPELWPWPPASACSNTGKALELWLAGGKYVTFDAINFDSVPTMTVSFQNDSISIPQYEVSYTGPNSNATVSSLTYVGLEAAMLAPLDSCDAWIINKQSTHLWYDTVIWTGPAAQLPSWTPVTAGYQGWTSAVGVSVRDLSAPQPLALPAYKGEMYVLVAIAMGGIFMFSAGPLILLGGLIMVNVERNKGLPIMFYRYMRNYRGW